MLKVLRKRKRSWLIVLALGAIIVVFVFWGIGNLKVDKRTIAARVNGKPITVIEYAKAYERQINYYRNVMKEQFNDALLERLNLKQNTINMLINLELGLREAKRKGITVSTEDIQKTIQAVPAFQKDGVFDKALYLQVLKANRLLPGEYEEGIGQNLIIEKLQKGVTDAVNVQDKDVEDTFFSENKKVNLQYLSIDSAKFEKTISVSDEDSKAYFEKNKERFKTPTSIKAIYVSIPFKDLLQRVKISDAEIREYYEKNLSEFQTQKEVSARHVLIKPDAKESDRKKAQEDAKKKTEDIFSLARKGEDFANLAKKYSKDPGSAKQGGSLGYFKQGDMVKPFEDAAFSLKKGEISGVIESDYGFHIIKLDDVKEARLIPLKEAKNLISNKLSQNAANNLASELASEIYKAVTVENKDLKTEAEKKKVKIIETGFFTERDAAVELVKNAELKKAAFSIKQGEISSAINTNDGIYIIKILDRKEEHIPAYEEIATSVKASVAKEKTKEKAKETADSVLSKLKQGNDLKKLATAEGYTTGESGFVSKTEGYVSNIGLYIGDKPEIFALTNANPFYSQVIPKENKFYILKQKERKEEERNKFKKRKDEKKTRLLREKEQEALNQWLNDLKAKAKIEINQEAL